MKKRLVKKWFKRYLNPLVKDLRKTITYTTQIDEELGDGLKFRRIYNNNHIYYDGYETKEGYKSHQRIGLKGGIINTAKSIRKLLSEHDVVLLRMGPEVYCGRIYVRLITEQVAK